MAGLMDFLLSLVNTLCGGSATDQQPSEYEKPYAGRPPHQEVITTRPQAPVIPKYHRQEQEPKPVYRPQVDSRRPYQVQEPKPVHRHQVDSRRPYQVQELKPIHRPQADSRRPYQVQELKPVHRPQVDGRRPYQVQEPEPVPQPQVDRHRPPLSFPPSLPDHDPRLKDQNQINQHDEHYMALRAKANTEGDLMARCFQQSHEAYNRGDGALAKQLSGEGKQHERTMESLNAQASAWIFGENNLDSEPGEIDLHGLYVKEAVSYADKSIQEARQRGDAEIRFIVGKGLHSDGHVAKLKPAIEDLMKKRNIPTEIDPRNAGVLISRLL